MQTSTIKVDLATIGSQISAALALFDRLSDARKPKFLDGLNSLLSAEFLELGDGEFCATSSTSNDLIFKAHIVGVSEFCAEAARAEDLDFHFDSLLIVNKLPKESA